MRWPELRSCNNTGSASVVGLVVLLPLMTVLVIGVAWFAHMEDCKAVAEEAARAGARYLASNPGDLAGAKHEANTVTREAVSMGYLRAGSSPYMYCNDPVAGDSSAPPDDPLQLPRTDGFAYCEVVCPYPIPLYNLWVKYSSTKTPIWGAPPPGRSWNLIGEAFYVSGEEGG